MCAVGIGALVLSVQCWDRVNGQFTYRNLKKMESAWQVAEHVPRDKELNEAFAMGYTLPKYDPSNAEYRLMLARLHVWRVRGLRWWPERARAESDKAIESLKAALARRPTWSDAWIRLAMVKYRSGAIDQELFVALEKAIQTGRYETAVHHGVASVGLRVWDMVGPDLKEKMVDTLHIGLGNRRIRGHVVEQIVMTGKTDPFKARLESDTDLKKLMGKYVKLRNVSLRI